jgi:hypothetical protein
MTSRFFAYLGALLLALIISFVGVSVLRATALSQPAATSTPASVPASTRPALASTATLVPAPAADLQSAGGWAGQPETAPFVRTELFFGSERPGLPEVSDAEFKQFLDEEITPRFPDGLTVLKGFGQFREEDGAIVQETSFVLVLLYPRETLRDSSAKVEQIRVLYLERFGQESVLRVDDPRPVRVAF